MSDLLFYRGHQYKQGDLPKGADPAEVMSLDEYFAAAKQPRPAAGTEPEFLDPPRDVVSVDELEDEPDVDLGFSDGDPDDTAPAPETPAPKAKRSK